MEETPNLQLPYLVVAQAQKHVTYNEALRILDAVIQPSIEDRDLNAPPTIPAQDARYVVVSGASGAWSGHDGRIAAWQDGAWRFIDSSEGFIAYIRDEGGVVVWYGAKWSALGVGGGGSLNPAPLVGINTTEDQTNRLAVNRTRRCSDTMT